jgi:hypothetical protein
MSRVDTNADSHGRWSPLATARIIAAPQARAVQPTGGATRKVPKTRPVSGPKRPVRVPHQSQMSLSRLARTSSIAAIRAEARVQSRPGAGSDLGSTSVQLELCSVEPFSVSV